MQPCKALVKTTGNGDTMQIFVKPYYRTLTLTVKPSNTVAIVKSMIQTKLSNEEAIPSFKMTLAYAGKLLHDERILSDYCIANQATLAYGINMSAAEPPSDTEGPQVLCIQYPAERKAFSSDCFYKIRPSDTLGDLKMLVLAREGIVCTCLRLGYQDWVYPDGDKLSRIFGDLEALPTLRVIHYSRRARASRTVTRLATDLLREVLSYSDLRTLAAGAATCRALLEAVPPKLAHELVVRKFPILSTIVDAAKPMPPARELFESQTRLFDGERQMSRRRTLWTSTCSRLNSRLALRSTSALVWRLKTRRGTRRLVLRVFPRPCGTQKIMAIPGRMSWRRGGGPCDEQHCTRAV